MTMRTSVPRIPAGLADVTEVVVPQAEWQIPSSLAALSTHGRTGWSRSVIGSLAMRLAQDRPVPLLVLGPPTSGLGRRG